jgi:chlorobactene glucosyltransferase
VRGLLQQSYPADRFGVVVMDDRSTDQTPTILARLAAEDSRLTVLSGTELPAGWQGKCWALHQAVQQAAGDADYLLFLDADTRHERELVSSSIAFAREKQIDMLSLAPGQDLFSTPEKLLMPTILATIMSTGGTMSEVNDPSSPAAKAVGQCILFSAEAYRRIGGHEAVKAEIVEDFAIARLAKSQGLRVFLADGRDLIRTRMYASAQEIWEGFSKNSYREAQRQPGGAFGGLVGLFLLGLAPWLSLLLAPGRGSLFTLQSLAQVGSALFFGVTAARALDLPAKFGLAQPAASAFLWGILANSTYRTLTGKGVSWKGRVYEK